MMQWRRLMIAANDPISNCEGEIGTDVEMMSRFRETIRAVINVSFLQLSYQHRRQEISLLEFFQWLISIN